MDANIGAPNKNASFVAIYDWLSIIFFLVYGSQTEQYKKKRTEQKKRNKELLWNDSHGMHTVKTNNHK